jgi:hypothetical protein
MNHKNISIVKSIVRVVGFSTLVINIEAGVGLLILAELFGIIEEMV